MYILINILKALSNKRVMAKIKLETTKKVKPKVKRTNVHAKSKTSSLKSSKNYKKLYSRQGK